MLTSPLPQARVPRRLSAALVIAATVTLLGLLAPAPGLASVVQWTPNSANVVETSRTCPSPALATYYDATCWTVSLDQRNPLYSPEAPYPWGQCTYWALEMRPDLWNNESASDPDPDDWTAYTWAQHSELEGLTVDHVPAAGAIVVWPQSDGNSTGHVAYVQSVSLDPASGDDLVTLQEMNDTTFDDPSQGQGDTLTMSMDSSQLANVQFVHTPGSPSTTAPPTSAAPITPATPTTPSSSPTKKTGKTPPARITRAPAVSAGKRARPHLSVQIGDRGLTIRTLSPAPLRATVRGFPSGRIFSRSRLHAGSGLRLPAGLYRVCVSQPRSGDWRSARACVDGTPSRPARTRTGRIRPQAASRPMSAALLSALR